MSAIRYLIRFGPLEYRFARQHVGPLRALLITLRAALAPGRIPF